METPPLISQIIKEPFAVIGKEGRGPAENAQLWIKPLWEAFSAGVKELKGLGPVGADGKFASVWGAMSDFGGLFKPWDISGGKYIAGIEAFKEAMAPEGWARWNIPGFTYLTARTTPKDYPFVFNYVLKEYMPKNGCALAGAVHEFYPFKDCNIVLYFPITKQNG